MVYYVLALVEHVMSFHDSIRVEPEGSSSGDEKSSFERCTCFIPNMGSHDMGSV